MQMISAYDKDNFSDIKRGEKGKRGNRPTPERFLENSNFKLGEFRALTENRATDGVGGNWLGRAYMAPRKWRIFTVNDVIEGIKAQ